MGRAAGWVLLTLVFVDEVLALVGLGVWGWSSSARWVLVWLLPVAGVVVWATFASPRAPLGGGLRRPVAKVVVFGAACVGLWAAGHPAYAGALLTFSVVVNGLAQLPGVRALATASGDRQWRRLGASGTASGADSARSGAPDAPTRRVHERH